MLLSKIVDPRFSSILKKLASAQVSISAATNINELLTSAIKELNNYETLRKAAIDKHGNKKEDGTLDIDEKGHAKFAEDKVKLFAAELNEALTKDVQLVKLKVEDLVD